MQKRRMILDVLSSKKKGRVGNRVGRSQGELQGVQFLQEGCCVCWGGRQP